MPLRQLTHHETWAIHNAYNRLGINHTVSNPPLDKHLRRADVPGKGQGYIARRNITRGTRILEESQLLRIKTRGKEITQKHTVQINRAVGEMPEAGRTLFRALSPAGSNDFVRFKRNSFNMSGAEDRGFSVNGIFEHASRFNHSCIPNAHFAWNPDIGVDGKGRLPVHGIRDIASGDEVVINYRTGLNYKGRDARLQKLSKDYRFDCTCPACDTQSPIAVQSELNRQDMNGIFADYILWDQNLTPGQRHANLTNMKIILELVKIEGIVYPQQAEIYGWLAEWCAREVAQGGIVVMSREESREMGLEAAREKLKLEIFCTGDRSSGVEEALTLIAQIS